MTIEEVKRKFEFLKTIRNPWESHWKDIGEYVIPRRSIWEIGTGDGREVGDKIYDGTSLTALQLVADGIQGHLVAPSSPWFRLKLANDTMDMYGVMDWLEEIEKIMYSELQRSSFYEATNEFLQDAASIGTAYMLEEDDANSGRLVFSTRHPKEMYISENYHGRVDTVFRNMTLSAKEMIEQFGEDNDPKMKDIAKETPYMKIELLHGIFPRTDRDVTMPDNKNKRYASVYVDMKHGKIVREAGYDMLPYHVLRWRKNSDETYGRSPASDALPDILRLNQIGKTMLKASQLQVEPPLNVPAALRGLEKIIPRGLNYYTNPQELITPINLASNYGIGRDQGERIEQIIKEHFRVDFFMMLASIDRQMTAREVAERMGEKSVVMGATIGRINSEFLDPVIERTFQLLIERNALPTPPKALSQSGGRIEIEFIGPLAQSQKRYLQSQGINPSLETLMPLSQVQPAILDNIDFDILSREIMEANGMPQKAVREMADVMKMRQMAQEAAQAQQQQMMQMQQQQSMMQNMDKLNEPIQPGSTLEGIGKQAIQQQQAGR